MATRKRARFYAAVAAAGVSALTLTACGGSGKIIALVGDA